MLKRNEETLKSNRETLEGVFKSDWEALDGGGIALSSEQNELQCDRLQLRCIKSYM